MPLADHKTERTFYSFGLGKVLNEQRAECVEKLSSLRVRDSSWITVVLSSIDSRLLQWLTRKQILLYILRFAPLGSTNVNNFETSLREVPPLPSPHTQKRVYEYTWKTKLCVGKEGGCDKTNTPLRWVPHTCSAVLFLWVSREEFVQEV